MLAVGAQLGPYQILAPLGAGGMGEVYRAKDSRLDREVAIKVLPEHLAHNPEALARFEREAKAVAALSHPNILSIHDFGIAQGIAYAVMELLEGETLRGRLERSALPWRKAAEIGTAVADGLAAAHAKGIIHRDLKPENIFLTSDGQVKILDFGLARVKPVVPMQEVSSAPTMPVATEPGLVLGTVGYMSPEQVRGEEAEAPSDIFLFGCVLYEMLTGRRAFARRTAMETLAAILHEDPPELANSGKHVPPELERIMNHCLEKDPPDRFQSARDLAFALRTISTSSGSPTASAWPPSTRFRLAAWVAAALAVLLLGVSIFLFSGVVDWLSPGPIRSLAVLPLENLSGNPEEHFFADGMTDELISNLMRIGALRVISRTSVMRYKGARKSVPEIARELKVDAVVEGAVRPSGGRVRITARLIHGATERQLWTNSYERDRRDVLALQSQVAQDIAQEIRIKVTPQEQARLAQVPSVNPDAFQLYSMGRYHWNKREEEDLKKAINYFAQAIAKDPNYALAYAGLADSYILGGGSLSLSEAMLKAKEAATKALGIDDTLAEAHTSLAVVNMLYDWSWPAAESEFHRAINLKPSYATAHHWYAEFLTAMGRHEEAFASIQQAQELDPHSLIISRDVGWHYYCAGLYDQAIKQCRNTLDLAPNFIEAQTLLGLAYVKKDMFAEAIAGLQKAVDLSQSGSNRAMLGYAYAMSGQREKAQQVLDALNKLSKESYVSPFFIAAIYGGLGDKDQAFVWLQKAYHERSGLLVYLKVVPMLDSLRSDPRFRNLAQRLGLPD